MGPWCILSKVVSSQGKASMNYTVGDKEGWTLPHFATKDTKCDCGHVLYAGGSVATVHCKSSSGDAILDPESPDLEEAVGNAILISNSPKMYELLKRFCSSNRMDQKDFRDGINLLSQMETSYKEKMEV